MGGQPSVSRAPGPSRHRTRLVVIALTLAIGLAACSGAASPIASRASGPLGTPSVAAEGDTQVPPLDTKQDGGLRVSLFSSPTPPTRGNDTLEVLITDAAGQPVSDASVSFDIDMTNMSHGRNVVAATPLGDGSYSADVLFLMPGPWRVIVGIARDGQPTTVRFDFTVDW